MPKEIKDPSNITVISDVFAKHLPQLTLLNDVNEGQHRLLAKADVYLPQEVYELDDSYKTRLTRASLRNYLLKIKRLATALVLRKAIAIEGDGENFAAWVTTEGQSLQLFAKNLLEAAWLEGFALVLTEFPKVGEVQNLRQQRQAGYRPYWCIVRRSQILSARAVLRTRQVDGQPVYGQVIEYLRFKSWENIGDDSEGIIMEYELMRGTESKPAFVAWRKWAVREIDNEPTWVVVDQGEINLDFIPVSPLYIEQEGFLKASLPLLETAELNLRHFQVSSDKYQILHLSANPKFVMTGVDPSQIDMSQSASVGLVLESPDAKVQWVTLGADPVKEHREVLSELKDELLNGAVQVFEQKNVAETEGSKAMDREQNSSLLALSAQGLENCLNRALQHVAAYQRTTPATVAVNKRLSLGNINPQEFTAWLQGWLSNAYTQETFLKKLEAGGFFEDVAEYDREAELERTSAMG